MTKRSKLWRVLRLVGITLLALLLIAGAYIGTVLYLNQRVLESPDLISANEKNGAAPVKLAARFIDAERFCLELPAIGGGTLSAYCDTGGGQSIIMPKLRDTGRLEPKLKWGLLLGIMPIHYLPCSDLISDPGLPKPYPLRALPLRRPLQRVTQPYFLVLPSDDPEIQMISSFMPDLDVFLAQDFFMNRSWTFDYLQQEIWLNTPLPASDVPRENVQKLGLKKNARGDKLFGHPSLTIEVDGQTIDVLFDTGATICLTEEGQRQLETDKKTLGGSFIAASVFKRWREKHPEWRFCAGADVYGDLIEVPRLKIGGHEVGPAWFAERRDESWSEGMIRSMDKVVQGALGGSAMKYLKVTIDYNSERIGFEKPTAAAEPK